MFIVAISERYQYVFPNCKITQTMCGNMLFVIVLTDATYYSNISISLCLCLEIRKLLFVLKCTYQVIIIHFIL